MVSIRRLSYAVLCSLLCLSCGDDGGKPEGPKKKHEAEEEPEPQPGWLTILIRGLPEDVPAGILVKGPEGVEKVVDASEVLAELEAGVYLVEAGERLDPTNRYAPSLESTEVEVEDGAVTTLEITFEVTDRSLFTITATDLTVRVFGKAELQVEIERTEGYRGAIDLRARDLPPGLSAREATIPPGEVLGRIPITSTGSFRTVAIQVEGEALGQRRTTEALVQPTFVVFERSDGVPGSLRSLLHAVGRSKGSEVPTITFDPQTFSTATVLEFDSTLEAEADVVLQGIPGSETPLITLDGGEAHTILAVSEDVEMEIRDLGFLRGSGSAGGAIRNQGTLTLRRVHIADSHALERGGGIHTTGDLIAEELAIEGCTAQKGGGGIYAQADSVTLTRSLLLENEGGSGGGGVSFEGGDILLMESAVVGNEANHGTGGLQILGNSRIVSSRVEGNSSIHGAGGLVTKDLVLISSSISGNSGGPFGGAMVVTGEGSLMNSTISENKSNWSAIHLMNGASFDIVHCTIAMNDTLAGISVLSSSLELRSSIVWGNDQQPNSVDVFVDGASATFKSNGYNFIGEDGDAGLDLDSTDELGANPLLLPLGLYGGPTKTMALQLGSLAVDFIPLEECIEGEDGILLVDQRGLPRPAGDGCDVGAYEDQ